MIKIFLLHEALDHYFSVLPLVTNFLCSGGFFFLENVVLKWDLHKNHTGNLLEMQIPTSSSQSFCLSTSEIRSRNLPFISILGDWEADHLWMLPSETLSYLHLIETYSRQFTQKSWKEFWVKWWIKKRNTTVTMCSLEISQKRNSGIVGSYLDVLWKCFTTQIFLCCKVYMT